MSDFLLSQVLVSVAIGFDILSFQLKKREHILLCLSLAGVFIAIHFFLLQNITAFMLIVLAIIRYVSSYFSTSKQLMYLFLSLGFLSFIFTFKGLLSTISLLGSSFQTIASFQKEDKTLRLLMIVGTTFWLIHNYLANSPIATLMEMVFLTSNLIGYYRFYIKPKKNTNSF